ncbi:MAG: PQQ-binding-like beta-propeller repeat protein [Actinomycetia bacterium]|nr:PQQ-binding-like beta-propeller repeat protein [Actinomycetes bacterium]
MYLHDQHNSARIDCEITPTSNIAWRVDYKSERNTSEGPIITTPVIYRNKVFLLLDDGFIRALDLDDGSEIWENQLERGHVFGSSLCASEGNVYYGDWFFMYASSVEGRQELCPYPEGRPELYPIPDEKEISVITPMIPGRDALYFATNSDDGSHLRSMSMKDAHPVWKSEVLKGGSQYRNAPCIANGRIYLASGGGLDGSQYIYCIDQDNGRIMWERSTYSMVGAVVFDNDMIYSADGFSLFCLQHEDGEEVWSSDINGSRNQTPVIIGDRVVVDESSDNDGYGLVCFNKDNGNLLWRTRTDSQVRTPLVATSNVIIFGTEKGEIQSVDPKDGSTVHTVRLVRESPGISDITLTPKGIALSKNRVVVTTEEGTIICLGGQDEASNQPSSHR